jgi:hypothetical protein
MWRYSHKVESIEVLSCQIRPALIERRQRTGYVRGGLIRNCFERFTRPDEGGTESRLAASDKELSGIEVKCDSFLMAITMYALETEYWTTDRVVVLIQAGLRIWSIRDPQEYNRE